jgi:cellulase
MKSIIASTLLPALALAHGHVDKVVADGVTYQGWNAALKYQTPIPATVGWQADNLDNGFVTPDKFGSVEIVCHKQGKSNGAWATVKAGGKVTLKWVRSLRPLSLSIKTFMYLMRT